MLYGDRGRNGKTVIMETLKKVLGPYMGPVPAEMLLDRNVPKDPDSASPTIMNLNGLRIVWASETNENRRFSTSQVKLLSGSDSLTGRYLWDKENTEFRPTHTLFLMTNFLPRAPAHDTAFWERLKLVHGDESKLPELMRWWEDNTADWMDAWAQDRDFGMAIDDLPEHPQALEPDGDA